MDGVTVRKIETKLAGPIIVQSDRTVLLEADHPGAEAAREALAAFAELVKCPEHMHTYAITPLSLWNGAAAGVTADRVVETLARFSRYPIPQTLVFSIRSEIERYGRLKLVVRGGEIRIESADPLLLRELLSHPTAKPHVTGERTEGSWAVPEMSRGPLKQALIKRGWPVQDMAGYVDGAALEMSVRELQLDGAPFVVRDYQRAAGRQFTAPGAGHGVIALPCGAGKTIVGLRSTVSIEFYARGESEGGVGDVYC